MSNLTVSRLSGPAANSNQIVVPSGHHLIAPGHVLQVQVKRYDTPTTYTTGTSGVEFTDMRVSITPKSASSMILCIFQCHGEGGSTHDYIYRVFKNGATPTGTYAGFNNVAGNQYWSGIAQGMPYEPDYSTTPFTTSFHYHDFPGVTTPITYAPGMMNAAGSAYVWYLNRPVASTGTTNQEVGVSFSIAMEIGQ